MPKTKRPMRKVVSFDAYSGDKIVAKLECGHTQVVCYGSKRSRCLYCSCPVKAQKTMEWAEFRRLCLVNSSKVPAANIAGHRHKWVGIGLVDEGPNLKGDEVVILENGKVPKRPKTTA